MNKRTFIISLIFAFIVIFVYSVFYGVPFGNYIAKAKISDYVKQVYGITEEFQMPQYNFLDTDYLANIPQLSSDSAVSYDLWNNLIYDKRVNNEFNGNFQKEYEELKKSYITNLELPVNADLYSSILANGSYSNDIYKLTCFQKIYLLSIVNHQKIPIEESTKMPSIVTEEIINKLSSRFNITSMQVLYIDLNGAFEIIIDGKDAVTLMKMQKHTTKLDKMGEMEKELILELNK